MAGSSDFEFEPKFKSEINECSVFRFYFILIAMLSSPILIVAYLSEADKIGLPFDPDNQACGSGNQKDYPFIYFPNPNKENEGVDRINVCVQYCPRVNEDEEKSNYIPCAPNSLFPDCNIGETYLLYDSIEEFGKVCMPTNLTYFQNVSPAFRVNPIEQLICSMQSDYYIFLIIGIVSFIISFISIKILVKYVNRWYFLCLNVLSLLFISIIFLKQSITEYPNDFWVENDEGEVTDWENNAEWHFTNHIIHTINGNRGWDIFLTILSFMLFILPFFLQELVKNPGDWELKQTLDYYFKRPFLRITLIGLFFKVGFFILFFQVEQGLFSIPLDKKTYQEGQPPFDRYYMDTFPIIMNIFFLSFYFAFINHVLNVIIRYASSFELLNRINKERNPVTGETFGLRKQLLAVLGILYKKKWRINERSIVKFTQKNKMYISKIKDYKFLLMLINYQSSITNVISIVTFLIYQVDPLQSKTFSFLLYWMFIFLMVGVPITVFHSVKNTLELYTNTFKLPQK